MLIYYNQNSQGLLGWHVESTGCHMISNVKHIKFLVARITNFLVFPLYPTPWRCLISCPCWASQLRLTSLRMSTFPLWQNLPQASLAFYLDPADVLRPLIFTSPTIQIRPCLKYGLHRCRAAFPKIFEVGITFRTVLETISYSCSFRKPIY